MSIDHFLYQMGISPNTAVLVLLAFILGAFLLGGGHRHIRYGYGRIRGYYRRRYRRDYYDRW